MKAKPIEPGCLAMIIKTLPEFSHFIGEITKVIALDEIEAIYYDAPHFEIDIKHPNIPRANCTIAENCLLRIDDPDLEKEIQSEEEKTCSA